MKSLKSILIGSAFTALLFAGCSTSNDDLNASGESLTVEGIAATGWAITGATITITDAEGEVLFTGTTDALGAYLADIDQASIDLPLSVVVTKDTLHFEAIIPALPGSDSALVAHINPVTDVVAKALRTHAGGLKGLSPETCDSLQQLRMSELFGDGVRYESFAHRKDYVAAVREKPEVVPSTEDMILHTLAERAQAAGVDLDSFLTQQVQEHARLLQDDDSFQGELAVQMQNFHMEEDQIRADWEAIADSTRNQISKSVDSLRAEYEGMRPPVECMDSATQAQIAAVFALKNQLQANPADSEVKAQLELQLQVLQQNMEQLRTTCEVEFEMPEFTQPEQAQPEDTGSGSEDSANASDSTGSGSENQGSEAGASSGSAT